MAPMNCVFCDIIRRQKPARVFFEDETTIVFADIMPKADIHLLICPKEHYTDILNLPDNLALAMVNTARIVARELGLTDNFQLKLHNGAKAGQIIPHIHFHFLSNGRTDRLKYK